MRLEDMILVSVDDHVVEPPDMFDQHLSARWKSRAPRVTRLADGSEVWVFEKQPIPNIGLNAVVGRRPEEYGVEPTAYDQMRPGCWDVDERIRDMNANGVLASMCFPSFPSFCGALFARQPDKELARAMLQAYNDWHIDGWCGSHPGRFIPLSLPPIWDPELMAEEIRRVGRKGCHAVSFTENPEKVIPGLPSLHSDHWDPFWRACADEGTVVAIHIGSASGMNFTSMDSPVDVMITTTPISIMSCAADLLWSPILRKFPGLRFALSEGGIGWIPYPHSDSTWPRSPETLFESLRGVPDDEIDRMAHRNAMQLFRLDAFRHRPRERCTVGALRAEAEDVDLSPHSAGGKAAAAPGQVVTAQHIVSQLAALYATRVE